MSTVAVTPKSGDSGGGIGDGGETRAEERVESAAARAGEGGAGGGGVNRRHGDIN